MDLRARVDDAELVRAAQAGDGPAFGVLFDRWSPRVLDVAYRIVRDREVAAEVAQDAFLAAWTGLAGLERAESFGGWVLRIGRNRALNRLERERRSVPVGDEEATDVLDRPTGPDDEADKAASQREDAELVWAAAAALGPRDASVLDLHLRHGLSPGEIAEELGLTANTAHQVLHRLRIRLGDAVRACVLWRAGHPACAELGAAVADAGVTAFGTDAVRVITAHAQTCDACTSRQEARLAPEALFAAAPVLVVAPEVVDSIRSGLADAGVPIEPAPPSPAPGSGLRPGGGAARRQALVAAAVSVVVLVAVAVLLLGDDGPAPDEVAARGTISSASAPSSVRSGAPTSSISPSASSAPKEPGPGSTPTGPEPGGPAATTTDGPGASSLPAPAPPPTTGPSTDVGDADEPAVATNPPGPTTAPPRPPTTTTTTPPPPPPVVSGFQVARSPGAGTGCLDPSHRVAFVWSTTGADGVTIAGRGAPASTLAPSGNAVGCLVGAESYTLTATGPGGSSTRTVPVPA